MFDNPFDNPFLELLGVTRTAWREDYAEFQAPMRDVLLNRQGVLQGGMIATLLDVACGYSGLYSADPERPVHGLTLSLTCNFLERGTGELIVAKGFVERRGGSIFFARGEVWMDSSTLIATAQGTFKYGHCRMNETDPTHERPSFASAPRLPQC